MFTTSGVVEWRDFLEYIRSYFIILSDFAEQFWQKIYRTMYETDFGESESKKLSFPASFFIFFMTFFLWLFKNQYFHGDKVESGIWFQIHFSID